MELKDYQQLVINDLVRYLDLLAQYKGAYQAAYSHFWQAHPRYPTTETYRDTLAGVPHICFKVPTAGGKTYIACNALQPLLEGLQIFHHRMVVWLVPSVAILEQTYNNLNNPKHFYHQRLRQHFGSKVAVYQIDDLLEGRGFNPVSVRENVNILVLSYQSIRADKQTKDSRRIYKDNGVLMNFFENDTDKSYYLENSEVDAKSLVNVIRKYNPICVIDEAHNATSDLSIDMLKTINPCFVLELTATPRKDKKGVPLSNILSYIDSFALKKENMVKLPLLVQNLKDKREVLERAILLQKELESKAKKSPDYIRPIVLVQAQAVSKDKETATYDLLKQHLIRLNIPAEQIAIKTANIDEIKGINLLDRKCPIRYILTVDALKEGWDCPFAYILATVANKSSEIQIEQIVGRVLRKPYTKQQVGKDLQLLNMSYVLTSSAKFQEVLDKIVQALNHQGFTKEDIGKVSDVSSGEVVEESDFLVSPLPNLNDAPSNSHEDEWSAAQATHAEMLKNFVDESAMVYENDQATLQTQVVEGIVPVPADLKGKVNMISMKAEFKAQAQAIRLPQFFIKIPKLSFFGKGDEKEPLNYANLLGEFDLRKQSVEIDFDAIETDLYEVDIEYKESEQSTFSRAKTNEYMQKMYLTAFANQTDEGKKKTLANVLLRQIGNMPPLDDVEVGKYIVRILDTMSIEQLDMIHSKQTEYARKIKVYIESLCVVYAKNAFHNYLEREKIFLADSYTLPAYLTVGESTTIRKSLYDKIASPNSLETKFIAEIASLDNVLFWHKFGDKGKGNFCINAYLNHYPDFLIVTKNNKYILVETKGEHLNNKDTESKIELGQIWAKEAGKQYRYFMVFEHEENKPLYYNLTSIKSIIREL